MDEKQTMTEASRGVVVLNELSLELNLFIQRAGT